MSEYDELTPEEIELLKSISKVESSEGTNKKHETIKNPKSIHYGHRAVGTYGLMPNTIIDVLNRGQRDKDLSDDTSRLNRLRRMKADPQELADLVGSQPDLENAVAARHLQFQEGLNPDDTDAQVLEKWKMGPRSKISPKDAENSERFKALQAYIRNSKK
jgi:hypothetical protein